MAVAATVADAEKMKETLITVLKENLAPMVKSQIEIEVKALEDKITELKNVKPVTLHTKETGVIDDGTFQQVGPTQYRMDSGTVINTSRFWDSHAQQGYTKKGAFFEKLSPEAEKFCLEMKSAILRGANFIAKDPNVETKALDMSQVMNSGADATAGIFVPEDIRFSLLQFVPPGNLVWSRARVWPMTGPTIQWPKLTQSLVAGNEDFFGGVKLMWTEEGGVKQPTLPEFTQMTITAYELACYTEVTEVLMADSAINIGNLLVQLFQGAWFYGTDRAFISGPGVTRPLGIMNDPEVGSIDRVTAGKVQYEDMMNMAAALPSPFDAGAVWMMNKAAFMSIRRQKDLVGHPQIPLGDGYNSFGEGIAGYILGYPVVMSDYKTSALGSRGDVILGNWQNYFIGDRQSLAIAMSRHFQFQTNRVSFRAAGRIGGQAAEPRAFIVLDSTANPSLS